VDINPFAVAIARFRLLLAAWRYCEVKRLRSAPDFKVNLAVGDSLLHGARFDAEGKPYVIQREELFGGDELVFKDETAHHFEVEDAKELHRILGQQYHAVVGNPPYITVKDSSAACFWMKQVFHCKGSTVDSRGARQTTVPFEDFYEFDGTKLKQFPVVEMFDLTLVTAIQNGAEGQAANTPDKVLAAWSATGSAGLSGWLSNAWFGAKAQRQFNIAWQEELDWQVYELYGLIEPEDQLAQHGTAAMDGIPPDGITLGQRAFEIRMAQQMAAGELASTWFERHKDAGSKPTTELPAHWPDDYRALVERRIAFIEENKNINLIERPEYKRRWNTEPWAKRQQAALEKWLLTRLETYFHDADRMVEERGTGNADGGIEKSEGSSNQKSAINNHQSSISPSTAAKLAHIRPLRARFAGGSEPRLVSVRQLAQTAQADSQWMEAATVFAGRADFDVVKLVETLVLAESVPALPVQRYKPAGLRKREEWEKTWEFQRAEDAVEAETRGKNPETREEEMKKLVRKEQLARVGEIPVPPKYGSGDFLKSSYWKLRGKLDVPKERWVLYPGMEGGHDTSPVIAWAGWDHAQQAQALTGFYQQAKDTWGWQPERLAPLLAALKELLPWLHQWHNAIDPEYGDRISTTYQQFYETELHALRMTAEDIEKIRMGGGN
jgi:hypothetical protein